MKRIIHLLLGVLFLAACAPSAATPEPAISDPLAMEEAMTIELTSPAFAQGEPIQGYRI